MSTEAPTETPAAVAPEEPKPLTPEEREQYGYKLWIEHTRYIEKEFGLKLITKTDHRFVSVEKLRKPVSETLPPDSAPV